MAALWSLGLCACAYPVAVSVPPCFDLAARRVFFISHSLRSFIRLQYTFTLRMIVFNGNVVRTSEYVFIGVLIAINVLVNTSVCSSNYNISIFYNNISCCPLYLFLFQQNGFNNHKMLYLFWELHYKSPGPQIRLQITWISKTKWLI